ncbi:MAG TPA: hypothetical protein VMQ61_05110 [Thermoanaerobaculia bacterium]|nr:hypothetical protein [Thermoanaerobaculia bacterium]
MKKAPILAGLVGSLVFSTLALAATAKTYQVTGPVLEINSDMIAVQKGKDRWEIARDTVNVPADLKVGDKVTIEYRMHATSLEVKSKASTKSTTTKKKAA